MNVDEQVRNAFRTYGDTVHLRIDALSAIEAGIARAKDRRRNIGRLALAAAAAVLLVGGVAITRDTGERLTAAGEPHDAAIGRPVEGAIKRAFEADVDDAASAGYLIARNQNAHGWWYLVAYESAKHEPCYTELGPGFDSHGTGCANTPADWPVAMIADTGLFSDRLFIGVARLEVVKVVASSDTGKRYEARAIRVGALPVRFVAIRYPASLAVRDFPTRLDAVLEDGTVVRGEDPTASPPSAQPAPVQKGGQ